MLEQSTAKVTREAACELVLEPSGTRLIFAEPDGSGPAVLTHASSFGDDASPSLSVSALQGKFDVIGPDRCAGCVSMESRVIASEGVTAPRTQPVGAPVRVMTPPAWTHRGLLLRLLDDRRGVRGIMFISIPDGDFAAG